MVAFGIFAVGIAFWGVQKARRFGEEMADPAERARKVLSVLGTTELPEGYHAVIGFSVPMLFELAILSDRPPDESGRPQDFGDHGFVYVSYPGIGQDRRAIRDFFEGRSDEFDELGRHRIDLDLRERVSNGKIAREEDDVLWVSHRGMLESDEGARSKEGLVALMLIDCGDSRNRFGIWLGPDPDPRAPVAELELEGTVSDPDEIERFLSPIHPCR